MSRRSDKIIVLITGGNSGLGLETVKALAKSQSGSSYHVFLGSRNFSNAETAIAEVNAEVPDSKTTLEPLQIDLQSDESIEKALATVQNSVRRLDVLLNNAGAGFDPDLLAGKIGTREGWNRSYDINVTGTYIVTQTFMPLLLKSSDPRLLFITSGTSTLINFASGKVGNFQTPDAGWPKQQKFSYASYQASKAGMNMMYLGWVKLLEKDGVKCFAISPGFLVTGLAGVGAERLKAMGALDPSVGADTVRMVVEGERDADAGKIITRQGIQEW